MSVIMWWSFLSPRFVFILSFVIKKFATKIRLSENKVLIALCIYFPVEEVDGYNANNNNNNKDKS